MVKVLRNLGKIYARCSRWTNDGYLSVEALLQKRVVIKYEDQVILECEIIGIETGKTDEDAVLKELGLEKSSKIKPFDFIMDEYYDYKTIVINDTKYMLAALLIGAKELERSEKDKINLLKDRQKKAENALKKNLLEPQVEAIFNKYGMTCDLAENRVWWDPSRLNNILYEYLSDNLIKELKEFGIEAKLNDTLVNDSWVLLTPIHKKHFKVNLNLKENKDGI
jgi:hypothetical protein